MDSPHATGFMVLHSNQLEGLRELAVQFIRRHPLPVLAPEVLLVQSNGMKHWLELALAKDLGICAATHIELPSAHLWKIYRAVLGPEQVPAHMPLDKSPLVWRILRRLPQLLSGSQTDASLELHASSPAPHTTPLSNTATALFAPLANYLGVDFSVGPSGEGLHATNATLTLAPRAYQLAVQLADVLDGYQNYRADWLKDWAHGLDQLRTASGASTALPASQSWQPALWRDLLSDLAQDLKATRTAPSNASHTAQAPEPGQPSYRSRAEVHEAFMQAIQRCPASQRPAGVPPRIMVFGVSSLPMQTVQALAALGRVSQVLMLVQNPCQHYWGHVVDSRTPLQQLARQRQAHKAGLPVPQDNGALSEAAQYQLHTDTHPLLAAWGKQGRDYLHLLDGFDDVAQYSAFTRIDVFVDPVQTAIEAGQVPSMLAHLQSTLLHLEPLPATPQQALANDHSIVLRQTHSAQREVEVLHDQLLTWLDADPHLTPADIMVMVPDMARFAPHIHAVFGRFAHSDARYLPYSVADTTPRTEPLVQALDTLLQLPQLRLTHVEWQSLFEVASVRERFGLAEHEVAQIDEWLSDAGVRWGLDAPHRQPWGIPSDMADAHQNSWLFGLERLLLGYALGHIAMSSTDASHEANAVWGNTLPQAGVDGLDARLMDALLQWLRHTQLALQQLRQSHTPTQWVAVLQQIMQWFFKACDEADERLMARIMAPLETWLTECQLARFDAPLPLSVVRTHWMAQLEQPAMQRRFFGGGVQFATLMPMRAIPFKCVCLLGMNDGDYPRSTSPRDFDLMNQSTQAAQASSAEKSHWRAGDRSRREDDRYLFLEALLSARDTLYISWQGRRTTDHEPLPPSVLVAQLMDYLNAAWTRAGQAACQAPLQPLHAFSSAYFQAGTGFHTYAADWQAAKPARSGSSNPTVTNGNRPNSPRSAATDSNFSHATQATTDAALLAAAPAELNLAHLQRLLTQPVEVFMRDRLRLSLDSPPTASEQEEPFALDGLERYLLTQSIVLAQDPEAALQRLRLSGELALAGFGQAQQNLLLSQRETLREHLDPLTQDWPLTLRAQSAQFNFSASSAHDQQNNQPRPLQLSTPCSLKADWASGVHLWRTRADASAWLQIELRPGSVLTGHGQAQQPRADTLHRLWLYHLVACASGTPTTSVQIGLNGVVQINPLHAHEALAQLQNLVAIYQTAWAQPLPVARKTACAYLQAQASQARKASTLVTPKDTTSANATASSTGLNGAFHEDQNVDDAFNTAFNASLRAAQQAFEGQAKREGEWAQSPSLQRAFSGFSDIAPALPEWAQRLYGPMVAQAQLRDTSP